MFTYFETTSRQEREQIAENLKRLYNQWYQEENETYLKQRDAGPFNKTAAQINYSYAIGKISAIQAVFHELGIPFDGLYYIK